MLVAVRTKSCAYWLSARGRPARIVGIDIDGKLGTEGLSVMIGKVTPVLVYRGKCGQFETARQRPL